MCIRDRYKEALTKARAENKLVFINFTGYACTNCHWMKANMFTQPEVLAKMQEFVLVDLYTDGLDAISEENVKLMEEKYKTIAVPYYVILDADEKVLGTYPGRTTDKQEWLKFLQSGKSS